MNTSQDDIEDEMARICESEHDMGPLDYCPACAVRRTIVKCGFCNGTFEEGKWWAADGSLECDHVDPEEGTFDLRDDWDRPMVCEIIETTQMASGKFARQCNDPVVTPGATACDFHSRWLDADECDRTYQRLVAVK